MSKNLINKYVWLVETIYQSGGISLKELKEKWLQSDLSEGTKIAERTFHKWRIAVEEMFGIIIDCERVGGYHYYIANEEELRGGGLRNWLLDTFSVSNTLMEHKSLGKRILTESIPYGHEQLPELLAAMNDNRVVSITYQSYWRESGAMFEVHPYCVKMFKQRWYLLAYSPGDDRMRIYALDRIRDIDTTERTFQMPDDFDPAGFFSDFYGIIADREISKETVRLKVSADQSHYLRSLPLHHSQREVERHDEYSIFELRLRPAYDFYMELLSMGGAVEVLAPQGLREEMRRQAKQMWEQYRKK